MKKEKFELILTKQYQTETKIYKVDYFQSENKMWNHSECWEFDDETKNYKMIHNEHYVLMPHFAGGGCSLEQCVEETEKKLGI